MAVRHKQGPAGQLELLGSDLRPSLPEPRSSEVVDPVAQTGSVAVATDDYTGLGGQPHDPTPEQARTMLERGLGGRRTAAIAGQATQDAANVHQQPLREGGSTKRSATEQRLINRAGRAKVDAALAAAALERQEQRTSSDG